MIKTTLILLIVASFFIFGCQNETKRDLAVQNDANSIASLVNVFLPIGISIWSDMYRAQFHQYPDSKEKLRAFADANPKLGPTVLWDNIEDLSIGSTDDKKLFMKGTMVLDNQNGKPTRIPFSYPLELIKIDPNNTSPEMELKLQEIMKDIIKK